MTAQEEAYQIKYISPAARLLQVDELNGITQFMELTLPLLDRDPEIADNINKDKLISRIAELTGLPEDLLNATDTVKQLRESRAQQQQAMMQAELMKSGAQVDKDTAQAEQMRSAK